MLGLPVITFVLFVLFSANIYTDYFHHKWYVLGFIAISILCAKIACDDIFLGIFMFYCMASSQYVGMFYANKHFAHPKTGLNPNLSTPVLKSHIAAISLCIVYLSLDLSNIASVFAAVKILLAINIVWTMLPARWFNVLTPKGKIIPIRGMGANISTNATLLSLMSIFVLYDFEKHIDINSILLVGTFIAILKTRAGAGLISFCASLAFFFWAKNGFSLMWLAISGASFVIMAMIADLQYRSCFKSLDHLKKWRFGLKGHVWNPSGRGEILKFSNEHLATKGSRLFGIGMGAYQYIMPALQLEVSRRKVEGAVNRVRRERVLAGNPPSEQEIGTMIGEEYKKLPPIDQHRYIWAHNDIVQFFIESGYVGTILLLFVIFTLIIAAIFSQNVVFATFLICFALNAAANFPCHLAPDSVLAIVMIRFLML